LKARMVVTTYIPHDRLLSPGPWLLGTTKVYPGTGADIVMESISLTTGVLSEMAVLNNSIRLIRLAMILQP
jgi:hypothetical protein